MNEWEVLPKDKEPSGKQPEASPDRNKRLALAFAIAAISDVCLIWLEAFTPALWIIDFVTAVALFLILGRQWLILPGLIAEAVPGLALFPFWILVVGSIAVWGKVTPSGKRPPPA